MAGRRQMQRRAAGTRRDIGPRQGNPGKQMAAPPAPSQWGAGNAYDAGSTMDRIARNEYLNTLDVGGPREQAMNAMGYWNQGTPFTPKAGGGANRYWRGQAQANQQTGGFSAPGIYQQMDPQNRGYIGTTTVDQSGAAKYTPFATMGGQGGGGRITPNRPPRTDTAPRNNPLGGNGPRPMGGGQGGTRPHLQLGQQGKGGGKRNPKNGKGGFKGGVPGMQGTAQGVMGFPQMGKPGADFLPNTPGWEADRASASDALYGAQTDYNIGNSLVDPAMQLQRQRLLTDQGYATKRLDESLAERGLITSGLRAAAQEQNVAIPYGRQYQDLGISSAQQYAQLASQFGGANLAYQNALNQGLQNRFGDVMQAQPLGANYGQYQAQDIPGFQPYYPNIGRPGGGRRNPKKNNRRPNRPRR